EGRKIEILRSNPAVSFTIISRHEIVMNERVCSWTAKFTSVIGSGKAEIITDRTGKEKGLEILMGQYSNEEYDFSGEDLDGLVIIKATIEEMMGKSNT
ncbi:MAG: pyridoxamine 5'-phosphate oxidase family protein, partial [Pseudomonadota bacterium]